MLIAYLYLFIDAIEARLRTNSATSRFVRFGALKLDTLSLIGYLNGKDMGLTQKEFALLHLLIKHQGYVVEKATLPPHLWSDASLENTSALYTLISRVKKKLHSQQTGITITLKRPLGYCIEQL